MLAGAQLWQWVKHETGVLDEGRIVTAELFGQLLEDELTGPAVDESDVDVASELADLVLAESLTMRSFWEASESGGQ